MALACGERIEFVASEVVGDVVVELLFFLVGVEFFDNCQPVGEAYVFEYLTAEGAFADRFEALFEVVVLFVAADAGVVGFEAFEVAEGVVVYDADESVEFEQGVLQRGGGEQDFLGVGKSRLDGFTDFVVGAIDVPEAVGFINDYKVPLYMPEPGFFSASKLV